MKKKVKIQGLDCAHCAEKMESAIKKIDGVQSANISFMTQKLTIETEEDQFENIMKAVVAVCKKVDSDCEILW